jgi:hypothetical protein
MARRVGKHFLFLLISMVAGLSLLLGILGVTIFIASRAPEFSSEVGARGAFLTFGLLFTVSYLCAFVVTVIPLYLLAPVEHFPGWVWAICGMLIFSFGIPVLSRFFSGPTNTRSMLHEAAMGCAAGLASSLVLFVLFRRTSEFRPRS